MDDERKVDTMLDDITHLKNLLDEYDDPYEQLELSYEIIYQAQKNPDDSMEELIKKAKRNWNYS
jgi:hypothetical protein